MRHSKTPTSSAIQHSQVNTLYINASKDSKICRSGDCQYSIENAEFRPNSFSDGYSFEGLLKVSVVTNDTTNFKVLSYACRP
jgi:hypothetical protein